MKKLFLFSLLSILFSNAFAQQPPITKEQQMAIDSATKQLNQSLANLKVVLHKLDSMHIPLQGLPEETKMEKQIIINKDENKDADDDSIEMNVGNWKIEVGGDNDSAKSGVKIIKQEEKIVKGKNDKNKEIPNIKTTWLGLDVGVNNYLNSSGAVAAPKGYSALELNPGKSVEVNLHVVHQKINLIKHILNLDYGLYFQINNYNFRSNNLTLIPHVDTIGFAKTDNALKKSKLTDTYLTIPVAFDIETNPHNKNKSFHIMAGGFCGVLIGSHTKQVDASGDKIKIHDSFDLNTLRYGLTARIGYGPVNFYVNYSLSNMFTNGVQPDLTPVSAGMGLWF